MNLESKKTLIVSTLFILFGAFSRLVTFLPNFSALEALALFGGAYIGRKYLAILIPLAAMFFSDLVINNTIARVWFPDHEGLVIFDTYMIANVIAIISIVMFGSYILKKVNLLNGLFGIVGATLLFWIISNLGTFVAGTIYPKTISGFLLCFELAIPFLKNSMLGNLVFGTILFGSYELYKKLTSNRLSLKEI